jgi:hypothetical protein
MNVQKDQIRMIGFKEFKKLFTGAQGTDPHSFCTQDAACHPKI